MRCWGLFKSYLKRWYFCFSRWSTWLGSICKFQPTFCGLTVQFPGPIWGVRTGWWSVLYFSSQSLWSANEDVIQTCTVGVTLEVHKQLHGFTFLSSSFSVISPVLPRSLGLPFVILHSKTWKSCYLVLPHTSMFKPIFSSKWQENKKKNNNNGDGAHPLGITAPIIKEQDSLLTVWLLSVSLLTATPAAVGLPWEKRERKKEKAGDVDALWPLGVAFFTPRARTKGHLLERLCSPTSSFQLC